MTSSELRISLDGILRERLGLPSSALSAEVELWEMCDSLDVVDIAMSIEEEFQLQVPDAAMHAVRTVGDLHAEVSRLLRAQRPSEWQEEPLPGTEPSEEKRAS